MGWIKRRAGGRWRGMVLGALGAIGLMAVVAAQGESQSQGQASEKGEASSDEAALEKKLGGADRYLTHLSTDKPMYRPGETVRVRGVMLEAHDRTPLAKDQQPNNTNFGGRVQIKGPKGNNVAGGQARVKDSTLGFAWEVPDDQAGGQYTVEVSFPHTGHPPAERTFDVRAYRSPSLKTQIEFVKKAYGPGDEVTASVSIKKAEGGVPRDATVEAVARVDGETVHRGDVAMNAEGHATARFALPQQIKRGQGTLAFIIDRGGQVQTASKTIPIVLQTLDLNMYPEGGDLVSGLESRVYVQAWTPYGDPADFEGVIVNQDDEKIAEVSTMHEGRGRFTITPKPGDVYALKVKKPADIKTTYGLPRVKDEGAVLRATRDQYPANGPIELHIASTMPETELQVTLAKRDKVVAEHMMPPPGDVVHGAGAIEDTIELTPESSASGVLRATVKTAAGKPLAERLVYRKPAEQINVDIDASQSTYVPGDPVELTVRTTDGQGEPIGATVGLTVTDDSVLELIDKRDQAPQLPAMALLEPHVQELSDSHVYLSNEEQVDGVQPKRALDLLLGTQGWRRFAFVAPDAFVKRHGDAAKRVLALKQKRRPRPRLIGAGGGDAVRALEMQANQGAAEADGAADNADGAAKPNKPADARPEGAEAPDFEDAPEFDLRSAVQNDDEPVDAGQKTQAEKEQGSLFAEADRAAAPRQRRDEMIAVREYAHEAPADKTPDKRTDFTETVYWHAGLKTDETTGEATVEFELSDMVTGFRVHANAFDARGAVGHGDALIESVEPFYAEAKMPLQVTTGDTIKLPVTLVNNTGSRLANVRLTVSVDDQALKLKDGADRGPFAIGPDERKRVLVPMAVAGSARQSEVTIEASSDRYTDQVTRPLTIKSGGFPDEIAHGGMLHADSSVEHSVKIPDDVIGASLTAEVNVHPTPLSNMTESLERLIREPHGCFEQTSSTTYPLAMAQQYFQTHAGVDPELIARSKQQLDKGYQRLIGFECSEKGYEWFGKDPMHPGLTAYGLMEFADLKQVRDVDEQMMRRTRQRLLDARDGEGNFKLAEHALHGWVPDQKLSNAYITWALLETGMQPTTLATEIEAVLQSTPQSENTYIEALAANVASMAGQSEKAASLLRKLRSRQAKSGLVKGGTGTIVGSRGDSLKIETTALATLAFLRDQDFTAAARQSIEWLSKQCKDGRYGSTQSTVLALQAIVRYDKMRAKPNKPGRVQLMLNGETVGEPVEFDKQTTGTIELPDISDQLDAGSHTFSLKMVDGARMPYSMNVKFNRTRPSSSDQCPLRVDVALSDDEIAEGNVTEANVTVEHVGTKQASMPTAIVGIPGGLEVRHDQLKELVEAEKIAAYEVIDRDVVLYWRSMRPGKTVELALSLVAAIPGEFTAPASRAYLYYGDEHKQWVSGLHARVTATQ